MRIELAFRHSKITTIFAAIAVLLVSLHTAWLGLYFYIDDPQKLDFSRLIDLDYEGNIPTLFSALLFIINSALLFLIAASREYKGSKYRKYWLGLAAVFLFLGFDEGTRLHEEIGDLVEQFVNAEGVLYFPWVIPYSILFVLISIFYLRFYLSLERRIQIRLFFSAILFLSGALGFEMLSATQADAHGTDSFSYSILYTIEEALELAGLILFLDTLLVKISKDGGDINIGINIR